MSEDPVEIIRLLNVSEGTDFENAVSSAFCYLGLESEVVGGEDGEVDVIAKSRWLPLQFKLVCECNAVGGRKQVKNRKLGQIRGAGPKHRVDDEPFHMVIVGRPKFSTTIIKNSVPNVCLLLAEDLVYLVGLHETHNFSNNDLEFIFMTIGEAGEIVKTVIQSSKRKLRKTATIYALICLAIHNYSSIIKTATVSKDSVVSTVQTFGQSLSYGVLNSKEISDGIIFLSSPIMQLFQMDDDVISIRGVAIEKTLLKLSKLGRYGQLINDKYNEMRSYLQELHNKAEEREKSFATDLDTSD